MKAFFQLQPSNHPVQYYQLACTQQKILSTWSMALPSFKSTVYFTESWSYEANGAFF